MKTKPVPENYPAPLDVYGNELCCGAKVAFNYQGEVRLGNIVEVKFREVCNKWVDCWTNKPYFLFLVSHHNTPPDQPVVISKVKDKNIVSIEV